MKSFERVLLIRLADEKALARLTKLRGANTLSQPTAATTSALPQSKAPEASSPSRSMLPWAVCGLVGIIVIALIIGIGLLRRPPVVALNNAETLAVAPTTSLVIVTRKPTEAVPTETATAAAVVKNPTFVPSSTQPPTRTPIVPTEMPTIPYVPQIISTPARVLDVPLAELTEFGGGTGRILYAGNNIIDLHDGSRSGLNLNLPQEIENARWVSDGRQLMVSKDFRDEGCHPDLDQRATPQACVGFLDIASGTVRMIDGIPLCERLFRVA